MAAKNEPQRARVASKSPPANADVDAGSAVHTEGQRLFLLVPGSLASVAERVGCSSKQTVANWRAGTKSPGPAMRSAIERAYGIPVSAWERPPESDARPAPPSRKESPLSGGERAPAQTMDEVLDLLKFVRKQMDEAASVYDRAKWAREYSAALSLKHRLERSQELLEDAIVRRHPMWRRIKGALLKALERHPEALRDVADALAEVGALGEDA